MEIGCDRQIAMKPLKKPRLGIPDVYPQHERQKEDELTHQSVKHGFNNSTGVIGTAEHSSAKDYLNNITAQKVGSYFNAILAKKEELMILPDSGRKKQQISPKDNFWPVTPRAKATLDNWFKDLAGSKPLASLARKAPSFNKKEDIFAMLCENQVTMQRAVWFIKLSSAYTAAVSEAKIKKRQMPDPATEWTATLIKFLKELVPKLNEHYHQGPLPEKPPPVPTPASLNSSLNSSLSTPSSLVSPSLSSPASSTPTLSPQEEQKLAKKQWTYCTQLAKYMYEEGLLDKHEFLNWVLDLLDKMKSQPADDGLLRIFLPIILQYMHEFVQSERFSRRLAYQVAKKLLYLINGFLDGKQEQESKTDVVKMEVDEKPEPTESKELVTATHNFFREYLNCPHHHDIVLQLSSILQVVTIECSTALIWCGMGSPLDIIPVPPSSLPLPTKAVLYCSEIKRQLLEAEEYIRQRSKNAEARWCRLPLTSPAANSSDRILASLDALDTHCFDKVDSNNCLETLYSKIFSQSTKEQKVENIVKNDQAIVKILAEWAVSSGRWGEHRAMLVALLLDKRQNELQSNENETPTNDKDDKDSVCSGTGGVNIFQQILMDFLDNDAPVLAPDNPSPQNKTQFTNLVHLFNELIRHDVFSHDAYMCTLISRGDLLNNENTTISAPTVSQNTVGTGPVSNTTASPSINHGLDDDMFGFDIKTKTEEFDDSNVDMELGKLLQHIKEDQQNSMDAPDSPKEPDTGLPSPSINRHFLYTTHFPLSQDDPLSVHDCNQRYILLFGVGRDRDEKRHAVKKMSKEICKLFSKKFSIDVAEGGKVKKHSRNEFNFESTSSKCQAMSFFDQHVVTWQCAVTVQEMLNSFAIGNSNYLPVQEHVAFLFDLMETAVNIYGLIDICIQILKELPEVEVQLVGKNSNLAKNYTTSLSLYVVGVLRRYHCCLLLSADQVCAVFEGLCKVVKHVTNPSDCSSAERCILAYLYDLYSACSLLKTKPASTENFQNAYPKIKQALYAPINPSTLSQPYNPQLLAEVFSSPRRGGRIEAVWARILNESVANRYSFVCNALIAVARETDNDRLNDIAITCAELTACCNALSQEWLGVLLTLCSTSMESGVYADVLMQVNIHNFSIHNSIAIFTCILVARHCFSLENFVKRVAMPSLMGAIKCGQIELTADTESSARLLCHLLLRLFKTSEVPQPGMYSVSTSPNPMSTTLGQHSIKLSCDRHLLTAAHNKNVALAAVLAVLKGIILLTDASAQKTNQTSGKKSGLNTPVHPGSTPKSGSGDLSQILGTSELGILGVGDEPMLDLQLVDLEGIQQRQIHSRQSTNPQNENSTSLSDFSQHVLKQICSQEWVLERCINFDELYTPDMLLDDMLTSTQTQKLLHMICYTETEYSKWNMDQKSIILRILENLDQWTLRISFLDLELMYKQTKPNSPELSNWLDTVARAAIDVFEVSEDTKRSERHNKSMWLVAPLVSKLPPQVQGRILRVAGQVLESTNLFTSSVKIEDNDDHDHDDDHSEPERKKSPQLNHQPFLGLILTCLKGQDEQKEGLLQSLHSQLSQFVMSKEMEHIGGIEDPRGREEMLDALQLRFSLIGGMFDAIQKNTNSTTDWAILLVQLISQGVIDLTNNSELFTTVLDMLATLIHSTLVSDSQSERDENKKLYTNLMKKLKKELGDKNNASIKYVRQLLPLSKQTCEIIACEPLGGTDSKGNKITIDGDKKTGLHLADKQRVSVWDLLEGSKNPAPLSWAWFGAVKMERKPLMYEEAHRLLKYHTHTLVKPSSYFYEPLPLPPEDLEPEKSKDDKADTPSSLDQSPAGRGGKGKGMRRSRKTKGGPTPPVPSTLQQQLQQPTINQLNQQMNQHQMNPNQMNMQQIQQQQQQQQFQMNMQGQNPMMMHQNQGGMMQANMQGMNQMQQQQMNQFGGNQGMQMGQGGMGQPQQQWGYTNQMQANQVQNQMGPQGQPPFYQGPQQINRFERPTPQNLNTKQAISQMLRQRNPPMGQAVAPMFGPAQNTPPQGGYLRNQLGMPSQLPTTSMTGINRMMNPQQAAGGTAAAQMLNTQQINQPNPMMQQGNSGIMMNQGMANNQGMLATTQGAGGGGGNTAMLQQTTQMGPQGGMMAQQNPAMMNQGMGMNQMNSNMGQMNNTNTMGMQNMQNVGNQQQMFQNQQYQGMNQNYGGYGNQSMQTQQNPQAAGMGSNMMGNFQQQRSQQAEYLAQQRALQQANRGQYMQQAPNVTMSQMSGQQAAPPYSTVNPRAVTPAMTQQQQFQHQQRIRQQMMMQQQGMAQQQPNNQGMVPNQGGGMGNAQPQSALVAQLQRQLPQQQQQNMMGQQFGNQQPPPY